jgi:hypothetical protein
VAETLLQPAINLGLPEREFWEMTVAEIERFVKGAEYRMRLQAQMDYMLGNLIGISVGRCVSKDVTYPPIEKVYPTLFEAPSPEEVQKEEEEKLVTNSTNRFMEFAMKHNAKFNKNKEV